MSSLGDLANGEKTGFLVKEGGSYKSWKKRWFVLSTKYLAYYKKQGDAKPAGVISLAGNTIQTAKDPKLSGEHCLEIVTAARVYRIKAESDAERDDWIAALQAKSGLSPDGESLAHDNDSD